MSQNENLKGSKRQENENYENEGLMHVIEYSDNQANDIYTRYLQPMKLKISQIILYDPETANELLEEYNKIIQSDSKETMKIMEMINDLEEKIDNYEKEKGAKRKLKEQQQIIYDMIDEIDRGSYTVSLDDCLNAFFDLRKRYVGIKYKDFQEREILSNKFHKLQANIIERVVREKTNIGLDEIIQNDDESGLRIVISQKINELLQSEDVRDKNRAQKIRNIMLTDKDCLYSLKLWQLMKGTEYEIAIKKPESSQTITLPTIYNGQSTGNNIMSLINRFLGLFRREKTTGMQLSDVAKIDMEWLAKQIKKNQSILEENERLKLETEGRENVNKIFIPDAKTPIYDFFEGKYDSPISIVYEGKYICKDYEYDYTDDNGLEKKLIVSGIYDNEKSNESVESENYRFICGGAEKEINLDGWIQPAIKYVQFIDKILGTDLTKKMLCELEECEMKESIFLERRYVSCKGKKWRILDKIFKSYYRMEKEYEKTRFNFRGSEEKRRKRFYQKYSFLENIAADKSADISKRDDEKYAQDLIEDKSDEIPNGDTEEKEPNTLVTKDENIENENEEHN